MLISAADTNPQAHEDCVFCSTLLSWLGVAPLHIPPMHVKNPLLHFEFDRPFLVFRWCTEYGKTHWTRSYFRACTQGGSISYALRWVQMWYKGQSHSRGVLASTKYSTHPAMCYGMAFMQVQHDKSPTHARAPCFPSALLFDIIELDIRVHLVYGTVGHPAYT